MLTHSLRIESEQRTQSSRQEALWGVSCENSWSGGECCGLAIFWTKLKLEVKGNYSVLSVQWPKSVSGQPIWRRSWANTQQGWLNHQPRKFPPNVGYWLLLRLLLLFLLTSRVNCGVGGRGSKMQAGREDSVVGRLVKDELSSPRFSFWHMR